MAKPSSNSQKQIIPCHRTLLGVDSVLDQRITLKLDNPTFLKRVYQDSELEKYPKKLPSIFALKEATAKALGITPPPWKQIIINYSSNGKPHVDINQDLIDQKRIQDISLSVTHCQGITTAVVVLLTTPSPNSNTTPE